MSERVGCTFANIASNFKFDFKLRACATAVCKFADLPNVSRSGGGAGGFPLHGVSGVSPDQDVLCVVRGG